MSQQEENQSQLSRQDVISIESEQNVAIDVNNGLNNDPVNDSSLSLAPEDPETVSVIAKRKRIFIGVSLMLLLLIPVLGGAYASYALRKSLYQAVDPHNEWPSTEYRGPYETKEVTLFEDKGYSSSPNNYVLMKNGEKTYFEVQDTANPDNPTLYISVYMIENLYGNKQKYGLHAVWSTDNDDLTPLKSISNLRSLNDFDQKGFSSLYSNSAHHYTTHFEKAKDKYDPDNSHQISAAIHGNLRYVNNYFSNRSQDQIHANFAQDLKTKINFYQAEFYHLSNRKEGGYSLPWDYSDLNMPLMYELVETRNSKRVEEEAKELKNPNSAKKVNLKPVYKKILLKPLKSA